MPQKDPLPINPNTETVSLSAVELEAMLSRAAQKGAHLALKDVGLDGQEAATDIQELRSLLQALNMAKRTAWQTVVRFTTAGLLAALIAGVALKLKLFGD